MFSWREGFGLPAFRCSHREGGAGIAAVDPCSGIFRASSRSVGIAIVAPSGIGTRCGAGSPAALFVVRPYRISACESRSRATCGDFRFAYAFFGEADRCADARRADPERFRRSPEPADSPSRRGRAGRSRRRSAGVDLAAVAAGRKPLFRYAFADPAQVAAIGEFHSLRAAARTMDGRGRDLRGIVHFAPFPGGALPKGVVVVDGSPAGVAVFAIQAAAGNQSFHHFCSFSAPPLFVTSPAVRGG